MDITWSWFTFKRIMLYKSSALSDVKILDFINHMTVGSKKVQILGDYGAEFYKIERIHVGDDFRRWNFLIRNRKLFFSYLHGME